MLDAIHRQHLEATRVHFEGIDREVEDRAAFRCGVGFADLSGFTRLSQQLPLGELSMVLSVFEETATETVHARGGRIVKFLGDAVMWVSAEPDQLVQIACDLAHHPKAAEARHRGPGRSRLRPGAGAGRRLLRAAGQPRVPPGGARRARSGARAPAAWPVSSAATGRRRPASRRSVRGFDDPVTPYALTPKT